MPTFNMLVVGRMVEAGFARAAPEDLLAVLFFAVPVLAVLVVFRLGEVFFFFAIAIPFASW